MSNFQFFIFRPESNKIEEDLYIIYKIMKYKVQKDNYSCIPNALYNLSIWANKKYTFRHIKKKCRTNRSGTEYEAFEDFIRTNFIGHFIDYQENASPLSYKRALNSGRSIIHSSGYHYYLIIPYHDGRFRVFDEKYYIISYKQLKKVILQDKYRFHVTFSKYNVLTY